MTRRASRSPCSTDLSSGFSLVELLVAMAILAILTALAVPAYAMMRQRFYDTAALNDVVNNFKAIESLNDATTFATIMVGPGTIPNLPGSIVSPGTQLFAFRMATGPNHYIYQVSASHRDGSGATYYAINGHLYALGANL